MAGAEGLLSGDRVLVEDPEQAARLRDKGAYGDPDGEALELDLHEAAYLVEEDRLVVRDADSRALVPVDKLMARGSLDDARFETRHLVYREYRSRGFVSRAREDRDLDGWERGASPPGQRPSALIAPRGEAEPGDPATLLGHVERARGLGRKPLLGVVDEESDVTYYELGEAHVTGEVTDPAPRRATGGEALLLRQRALLRSDPGLAEAGYGYDSGGQRFLSLAEAHHLAEHGLVLHGPEGDELGVQDVRERARRLDEAAPAALEAYAWLRERGLAPKTGFKYGVHFRTYEDEPGESHAPHLVQALGADASWTLREVSRLVRLAHSVNKRGILWSPEGALVVQWTRP